MTRDEADEIKRHFDVVSEGLRSEIRQVAEGVISVSEKIDRSHAELRSEMNEVKAMIKLSFAELDRRVRTLEETVMALVARVERLEGRQRSR